MGGKGVVVHAVSLDFVNMLFEDSSVNRLVEALRLWADVASNAIFSGSPVVLLFTMWDFFCRAIRESDLVVTFPEYPGPSKDPYAAFQWIREQFIAQFDPSTRAPVFSPSPVVTVDSSSVSAALLQAFTWLAGDPDNVAPLYQQACARAAAARLSSLTPSATPFVMPFPRRAPGDSDGFVVDATPWPRPPPEPDVAPLAFWSMGAAGDDDQSNVTWMQGSIQRLVGNDPVLVQLDLQRRGLGLTAGRELCTALLNNTVLQELLLGSNPLLGDDFCDALADTLAKNRALTNLGLASCGISNRGALLLLRGLGNNPSLRKLQMTGNAISDDRIEGAIARELAINVELADHAANHPGEPYTAGFPLELPFCRQLDLSNSGLTAKQCDALPFQSHWRRASQVDLQRNPHLVSVPRALGFLDAKKPPRMLFDVDLSLWTTEQEFLVNRCRERNDWLPLVLAMACRLRGESMNVTLPFKIQDRYKATRVLDLRGMQLDNMTARAIPFYLCNAWGCLKINLTNNPQLTMIPSSLGSLDPDLVSSIQVDVKNLVPNQQPFAQSAASMIGYARALLQGTLIKLNQVKLMVVGKAAAGKTTLVRTLQRRAVDRSLTSTDGIDIGEFSMQGMRFVTWDFGGQKVYRFTHQLFLSSNVLYLLLFKLSTTASESLSELRFWLNSILARCPSPAILFAATHADLVDPVTSSSRLAEVSAALTAEYPEVAVAASQIHAVSGLREKSVQGLREALLDGAQQVNIEAPEAFEVVQQYFASLTLYPPIVDLATVLKDLRGVLRHSMDVETSRLISTMDNLGLISVFPDFHSRTGGTIVLRPQWVATLLATIVTTKHKYVNQDTGLIARSVLSQHLWSDHSQFPRKRHDELLRLLTELHVIFDAQRSSVSASSSSEVADAYFFVPCMLREEAPDRRHLIPPAVRERCPVVLHRHFRLKGSLPISVIPPIMIELMSKGDLRARWQQGCVARISSDEGEVWALLCRSRSRLLEIVIHANHQRVGAHWVRVLCNLVSLRLTEFYHVEHTVVVPCPQCPGNSPNHHDDAFQQPQQENAVFRYVELQRLALERAETAPCDSTESPHRLRIDEIAPDILFEDLKSQQFFFEWDHLREIKELGHGAFGRVIKMTTTSSSTIESTSSAAPPSSHSVPESEESQSYA
ncbi:MAG: COR domain-containing protein, partial [archaeon]|nr:COR domain-containing protein [archaeon]